MDFIGNKKERFKIFLSHRYRFSIFDLSDARKDAKKFQYKSLITLMVIPVLLFYLLNILQREILF
jgi:hypothetical protein